MADNTVTTRFVADPRDEVLLALLRQQQETTNLQKKMVGLAKSTRKGNRDSALSLDNITRKIANVAAGYLSANAALNLLRESNRKFQQETREANESADEMSRRFQVQSGLRGQAAQKREDVILSIAERRAVLPKQAFGAATQLVSSGFSAQEASGASLNEFLKTLNASNLSDRDVDPRELAQALASYLNSQSMDLTGRNVGKVGRSAQALFRGTNLQVSDLAEFAQVGATFKGSLSMEEQLGSFAVLRQSFKAPESSTALRNVVGRLKTARTDRGKVRALGELGLTPEDVDLVGERFPEALDRLAEGLSRVEEKKRAGIIKTLFGERAVAPAQQLIEQRAQIAENIKIQGDTSQFASDVQLAESGRNAAARRFEVEKFRRRSRQKNNDDLILEARRKAMEEAGVGQFEIGLTDMAFGAARSLGFSSEAALGISSGGGTNPRTGENINEATMRNLEFAMRENTAAMKENRDRPQQVEMVNQPEARREPAAKALSRE